MDAVIVHDTQDTRFFAFLNTRTYTIHNFLIYTQKMPEITRSLN